MKEPSVTTTTHAGETTRPSSFTVVRALLPFGLGYFLSYLYRATNAVVAPDLVRDIGLSAGELGLLTAAYLLAFALFQLPLGILLDRYGPRRVQAALVAFGALGAFLFAKGTSATMLMIARAMIGLAFAGGLMSSFKAVVIWVPEPRRPLANALVMSIGAIGLLVATAPLEHAVQLTGWRDVFVGLSAVTIGVAALILFTVPERTTPRRETTLGQEIAEVGGIYRDRVFLALMPVTAVTAGAHIAIQTLWVGPWLRDVAGLGRIDVANRLLIMAAAFFVGILVTGIVADRLVRRGVGMLTVMLGFMVLFLGAQLVVVLGFTSAYVAIWSLFCMTGQVSVLAFPWLSSHFGASLSGRANTAANLPMFMSAFIFQYAIGALIDQFPTSAAGGYAPEAYQIAFGAVLFVELLAVVWLALNWPLVKAADAAIRGSYRRK